MAAVTPMVLTQLMPLALLVAADEQPPKTAPWQLQCPVLEAAAAHQLTAALRQLWLPLVMAAVTPMALTRLLPRALVVARRLLLSAGASLAARHHLRQRQRRCFLASRAHLALMELLASWAHLAPMEMFTAVATSRLLLSAMASLAARYYLRQRQRRWLLAFWARQLQCPILEDAVAHQLTAAL